MSHPAQNDNLVAAKAKGSRRLLIGGLAAGVVVVATVIALVLGNQTFAPAAPTPTATKVDPCQSNKPTEAEACPERAEFLAQLRDYQRQWLPQLHDRSANVWGIDAYTRLTATSEAAVAEFDLGNYRQALTQISTANTEAEALLSSIPRRLDTELTRLREAFANHDQDGAEQALNRALLLDPEHPELAQLAPRIAVLAEVFSAMETARVAQVENKPEVELAALRAVLQLDPERQGLQARIDALAEQQLEARFSAAIGDVESALARSHTDLARQHLARAQELRPERNLDSLRDRIETLDQQIRLRQALANAEAAVDRDEWPAAQQAFQRALTIDASNATAVEGLAQAKQIVAGWQALDAHLQRPLRLGTPRVAEHVRGQLTELSAHRERSPGLAQRIDAVSDYLVKASAPVQVTVLSDGLTEVSVRRVGIVGAHQRKTIQLTPGEYELEGRRPGYESTLVRLEIPFDVASVDVRVECHEPI